MAIHCRDACGARVFASPDRPTDESAAEGAGWTLLPITRTWRCGACVRAMAQAYWQTGREPTDEDGIDSLDPSSRGAIPKATAGTVSQPTVAP